MKKRLVLNKIMFALVVILSIATIIPLFLIFVYILKEGISIINWNFFTKLPKPVGESGGGVSNAIIGTLIISTVMT